MKIIFLLISFFLFFIEMDAQKTIPLYNGVIPGSKATTIKEKTEIEKNGVVIISKIVAPSLSVYLPPKEKRTGASVIICPGGGYSVVAVKHEGTDVAKKMAEWGVAAFVLKYRLPDDSLMLNKETGPLQDVQEAMKYVRSNAALYNINPGKVGVMGFSAGGHLAATAATHFTKPVIESNPPVNLRPDFLVLVYPVVSFTDSIGHSWSRQQLIGENPSPEKIIEYSNELQVTAQTPISFLVHAGDDDGVKPANSISFYEALLKNGVSASLNIYPKGGHGFGMDNKTTSDAWILRLKYWLKDNKFIK
jgi:acetyl esterase/lipase